VNEILEPLGLVPGVRIAVLVSPDGVPVVVRGREPAAAADAEGVDRALRDENPDSLAALAIGWLSTLARSVAPLSWEPPRRVVLRAARGTLVMTHAPGAVLLVVLERGTSPEDLRLPMDGAVARMQRILRERRERQPTQPSQPSQPAGHAPAPPSPEGPLPSRAPDKGLDLLRADTSAPHDPRLDPRQQPG
jgi:predicted regulator of Ras-like GTPase activity (Roadblock/LC7/MglB family)